MTPPSSISEIRVSSATKKNLDKPTLIAGFPGPGLVGSISTNYIIDNLKMRQIACIESESISPGVIYVGGKLRHPFRLYANEKGNICIAVCEAPIMINGIRLVMDILMKWSLENDVREVIVLDGIPIRGIPKEGRQPIILHDDGHLHQEVEKLRVYNNNEQDNNIYNEKLDRARKENNDGKIDKKAIKNNTNYNYNAYIGGVTGGLLSSCLSYGISCTAILVPSPQGLPDPEGAALLIDSFNKIPNIENFKIDSGELKTQGIKIRQQLEKIMQSVEDQRQQASPEHKLMYG